MIEAQASIGVSSSQRSLGVGRGEMLLPRRKSGRRSIVSNIRATRPEAGFFTRMVQLLAATDQFVTWWGDHRAWPANESPRIGRLR
jgi:hypothetical protein